MSEWIVARTKPRREWYAAENLQRQEFTFYLPKILTKGWRNATRRIEARAEVLFENYIFVEVEPHNWHSVLGTFGISNVILRGDRPAPMPVAEIHRLRALEDGAGFVVLPSRPRLQKGDLVRVTDPRFPDGQVGIWLGTARRDRERILLEFLNRKTRTLIATSNVVPMK